MIQFKLTSDTFLIDSDERFISFKETYLGALWLSKKIDENVKQREIKTHTGEFMKPLVGVALPHDARWVVATLACWIADVTPCFLNPLMTPNEIQWLHKMELIITIKGSSLWSPHGIGFSLNDVPTCKEQNVNPLLINELSKLLFSNKNVSAVVFTSGTTGRPKGIMHGFNSLWHSAQNVNTLIAPSKQDVWLASLPFFHIGGFSIFFRALISETPIAFPKSFHPSDFIKTMNTYHTTFASFVSTTLYKLVEMQIVLTFNPRFFFVGGSPISEDILRAAILKGFPIVKTYGSSETASMITFILLNKTTLQYISSSGKSFNSIKIKIENGEILVQSPTLYLANIQNDRITKRKLQHGWFHTGDKGFLMNKHLYVKGRLDDVIISGGKKVQPNEIEAELTRLPAVKEAVVFGINHKIWGEMVCAAITTKKSQPVLSEKAIIDSLRKKLSGYKLPKRILILEELPKNQLGKIDKIALQNIIS